MKKGLECEFREPHTVAQKKIVLCKYSSYCEYIGSDFYLTGPTRICAYDSSKEATQSTPTQP